MPVDQFTFVAESSGAKDGCGRRTVDSDPAQLWTAKRVVPTAGRFGGVADIAASPRTVSGTSRAAHPAHAKGAVADEHPVEPGGDGCDGIDGAKDHPRDRSRDAEAGRSGDITRPRLQAQRRGNCKSADGDVAGRAFIRIETIPGVVRFLHGKDR